MSCLRVSKHGLVYFALYNRTAHTHNAALSESVTRNLYTICCIVWRWVLYLRKCIRSISVYTEHIHKKQLWNYMYCTCIVYSAITYIKLGFFSTDFIFHLMLDRISLGDLAFVTFKKELYKLKVWVVHNFVLLKDAWENIMWNLMQFSYGLEVDFV